MYDTRDFVLRLREQGLTPHVAQNTSRRRSAIDGPTTTVDRVFTFASAAYNLTRLRSLTAAQA
jgi:hypothetical protein